MCDPKDLPLSENLAHLRHVLAVSNAALHNISAHFKDYRAEDPFASPTWENDNELLVGASALFEDCLYILQVCERECEREEEERVLEEVRRRDV
jgi:predicted FMN-binding regulatory protein PaiB